MKFFLKNITQRLFTESFKYKISLLYKRVFDNNSYIAHKDYVRTDHREKSIHILEALNYTKVSLLPNVYFEFGCHSARTFSSAVRAARELNILNQYQFFAFDSFEGLPDTSHDDGIFKAGTFKTGKKDFVNKLKEQADFEITDNNIIEGFYSETLDKDLQNRLPKVGVVHIDVDIYSSAKEVLNFIKPLLVQGTVIIFDDFYCFPAGSNQGESRALKEFLNDNKNIKLTEWKSYSSFGKSFFVTDIE